MLDRTLLKEIERHLEEFFDGHSVEYFSWERGPIQAVLPEFRVACFAPGPKSSLWNYASVGAAFASTATSEKLEFVLSCPYETPRAVELLAMFAHRQTFDPLGCRHLMPLGEPWLEDSACDAVLVSLPYPFGPDLEVCRLDSGIVRFLWLLPITTAEREFCKQNGVELLEQKFDECRLRYWEVDRASVV